MKRNLILMCAALLFAPPSEAAPFHSKVMNYQWVRIFDTLSKLLIIDSNSFLEVPVAMPPDPEDTTPLALTAQIVEIQRDNKELTTVKVFNSLPGKDERNNGIVKYDFYLCAPSGHTILFKEPEIMDNLKFINYMGHKIESLKKSDTTYIKQTFTWSQGRLHIKPTLNNKRSNRAPDQDCVIYELTNEDAEIETGFASHLTYTPPDSKNSLELKVHSLFLSQPNFKKKRRTTNLSQVGILQKEISPFSQIDADNLPLEMMENPIAGSYMYVDLAEKWLMSINEPRQRLEIPVGKIFILQIPGRDHCIQDISCSQIGSQFPFSTMGFVEVIPLQNEDIGLVFLAQNALDPNITSNNMPCITITWDKLVEGQKEPQKIQLYLDVKIPTQEIIDAENDKLNQKEYYHYSNFRKNILRVNSKKQGADINVKIEEPDGTQPVMQKITLINKENSDSIIQEPNVKIEEPDPIIQEPNVKIEEPDVTGPSKKTALDEEFKEEEK